MIPSPGDGRSCSGNVRLANLAVGPTSYSGADAARRSFLETPKAEGSASLEPSRSVAWRGTYLLRLLPADYRSLRRSKLDTTMDDGRRTPEHCEYSAQSLPQALERSRPPQRLQRPIVCVGCWRVCFKENPPRQVFFQSALQQALFHHRQPIGAAEQDDHIPSWKRSSDGSSARCCADARNRRDANKPAQPMSRARARWRLSHQVPSSRNLADGLSSCTHPSSRSLCPWKKPRNRR